jgi:hypothetical protein
VVEVEPKDRAHTYAVWPLHFLAFRLLAFYLLAFRLLAFRLLAFRLLAFRHMDTSNLKKAIKACF